MRESSPLTYTISRSVDLLDWSAVDDNQFDIVSTTPIGDGIAAHRTVRLVASLSSSILFYRITANP